MDSKVVVSESVCHDEVVDYIASRYSVAPKQVVKDYLYQDGIINCPSADGHRCVPFEENEMAILRDMGIRPTSVEFK